MKRKRGIGGVTCFRGISLKHVVLPLETWGNWISPKVSTFTSVQPCGVFWGESGGTSGSASEATGTSTRSSPSLRMFVYSLSEVRNAWNVPLPRNLGESPGPFRALELQTAPAGVTSFTCPSHHSGVLPSLRCFCTSAWGGLPESCDRGDLVIDSAKRKPYNLKQSKSYSQGVRGGKGEGSL